MKLKIKNGLVFLTLLPCLAFADINSDLDKVFDNMGMTENITAPHAYTGQQAGYYTGGSLVARSTVSDVQIVDIDLPKFNAGCGGIDLYMGGFSYIDKQEIVNMLRQVLNGAKAYAFKLAMGEVTPLINSTLSNVEDVVNQANSRNINSCETAEELVGGIWPKTRAAQQQVCEDVGSQRGIFSDWTAARQGCDSHSKDYNFDSTMQTAKNDPEYKSIVLDEGNIVWNALKNNNLVSSDTKETAEFLMSLSGSVIIRKSNKSDSSGNQIDYLPSLATNKDLIQAILYGKPAKIYKCDESDKCLNPIVTEVNINESSSLRKKFADLLEKISQNINSDTALTAQEIALIQSTRIPIYKILNVQAAYQKDSDILDIESYADVIATDVMYQYLLENINLVKASSQMLQYPDEIMGRFNDGVNMALSEVRNEQINTQNKISMAMQLVEQSQVLEQMLAGQLSSQVGNSLNWAKSLH